MAEILDIADNIPHRVSEVVCLKCLYRWIAVRPVATPLIKLECPCCHESGFVIETGENFD